MTNDIGDFVAVKSGFASGYSGEGPSGLSCVLQLLKEHGAEIDEIEVIEQLVERVDNCSLTTDDLEAMLTTRAIRPTRWYEYIFRDDWEKDGTLWNHFPPTMPFAIIDSRIMDLALRFFEKPDNSLLTGYRRLEDIVRKRTTIDEHGAKLFSHAFQDKTGKLVWNVRDPSEQVGRCQLFTAAYMAYRNPRAHRELEHQAHRQLMEFLLLNQLFALEKEAIERVDAIDQVVDCSSSSK